MSIFHFSQNSWLIFGLGSCVGGMICVAFLGLVWREVESVYIDSIEVHRKAAVEARQMASRLAAENRLMEAELDGFYSAQIAHEPRRGLVTKRDTILRDVQFPEARP